jgi:integrase
MSRQPAAPRGGRAKAKPLPGEEYLVRRPGSEDWHIDITIEGRRLRRSCGTADKALAAAAADQAHKALYREVVLGEKPARHLTLNEAFIQFYAEVAKGTRYGESAQKHQMQTILEVLGRHATLADLDDGAVNGLVQALRAKQIIPWNAPDDAPSRQDVRTLSPATVNRHLATLSAVCRRARETWKVEVGEWSLAKHKLKEPEGREVFLERDQARELVAAIVPHARPILLLALSTGLRKGNVHDLLWDHVSLDLGRIVLLQKGGRPHAVTLPPLACAMLETLQPDPALRKGPVFTFGNPALACHCVTCRTPRRIGQPIGEIKRSFATAARAIGVPQLRIHDLRHSFASWVLAEGGDLQLVRKALGHRDITTTARYSHLVDGRRENVIAAATDGLLAPPRIDEGRKKA